MFTHGKTKKTPLTTLVFDRFLFSLENHTARFQPSLAIIVQQNVDYCFITSLHVANVSHFVTKSYLKTLHFVLEHWQLITTKLIGTPVQGVSFKAIEGHSADEKRVFYLDLYKFCSISIYTIPT